MTLIVGVLCEDGVVMGADGAATLGDPRQPTIKQPHTKLSIINDIAILGTAGHVGLAQQFLWEIKREWPSESEGSFYHRHEGKKVLKDPEIIMEKLSELFVPHIEKRVDAAKRTFGSTAETTTEVLLAMPFGNTPHLLQFNKQAASEMASKDLPFVTIGSGRLIADTFLAFLKEVFWKDHQPKLSDGKFATLWTLDHAIENAPGYLGEPVQLMILENDDGWGVKELTPKELHEQRIQIEEAKSALRKYEESYKDVTNAKSIPKLKHSQ